MDQKTSREGFYITLPSNASHEVFQSNTSSSFRVDLAQHVDLQGSWQVALTEISYPHTWLNVPYEDAWFEYRAKPIGPNAESTVGFQRFTPGYYSNLSQLWKELHRALREADTDIYLVYNDIRKRLDFQAGGQFHLRFHKPFCYVIGMRPGKWCTFSETLTTAYPSDIKAGFTHLYCYSDCVSHQLVGDSYTPLLRTIQVEGTYGDIITQCFNPPDYLNVAKKHIENILIEIKTDQNIPVKFTYGKSIVKLHFRPTPKI